MSFGCPALSRLFRWRKLVLAMLVVLKVGSFASLAIYSLRDASKNLFLLGAVTQSFAVLVSLFLFLSSWSDAWPEDNGISLVEPSRSGKWQYAFLACGMQLGIVMLALDAYGPMLLMGSATASDCTDVADFNVFNLAMIMLEFIGQMLGIIAAIDFLSSKRNEHFVIDLPWHTTATKVDD